MPYFRKKPVLVMAYQWFPGEPIQGVYFEMSAGGHSRIPGQTIFRDRWYVVTIHQQRVYLEPGDWILPEPDGIHFYPVKPDVFKNTYEPA